MAELLDHLRELNKESEQASHTSTDSSPMLSKKAKVSLFTIAASFTGSIKSAFAAMIKAPAKNASPTELYNYAMSSTPVQVVDSALGVFKNQKGMYVLKTKDGLLEVATLDEVKAFIKSNPSSLPSNVTNNLGSAPTSTPSPRGGFDANQLAYMPQNIQQIKDIGSGKIFKSQTPNANTPQATGESHASGVQTGNVAEVLKRPGSAGVKPAASNPSAPVTPTASATSPNYTVPELFGPSKVPEYPFTNTSKTSSLFPSGYKPISIDPSKIGLSSLPSNINLSIGVTPPAPLPESLRRILAAERSKPITTSTDGYFDLKGKFHDLSKPSGVKGTLGKVFDKELWKGIGSAAASVGTGIATYYSAKSFDPKNLGSYLSLGLSAAGTYGSLMTFFATHMGKQLLIGIGKLFGMSSTAGPAGWIVAAAITAAIVLVGLLSKWLGTKEREMNQEGKDLASLADSLEASSAPTTLAIASGVALNGLVIGYDTSSTASIPKRQIFSEAYSSNIISTRLGAMTLTDASGNALSSTDPENTVYVNKNRTAVSIVSKNANGQREIITEGVSGDAPVTSSIAPEENYIEAMVGTTAPQRNGRVTVTNRINPEFERSVRLQRRIADAAAGAAASDPVLANNLLRTSRNTGKLLDNTK